MSSPSRIRKRFFVVTALMLAAVILIAILVLFSAARLSSSANLIRFSVRESVASQPVLGSGISLSAAESGNLLEDASFEPVVYRQALTIFSGDDTTLTVSSEEAGQGQFNDGFFNQADARVMTRTSNGLVLKKAAQVAHFGINRVGVFQPVVLPGDMPANVAFLDFARQGEVTFGVGRQGLIDSNLAGQAIEVVESGITADLSGICANEKLLAACSAAGDLLLSDQGRLWRTMPVRERKALRSIAISDRSVVVAVGDAGSMVTGTTEGFATIRPLTKNDLTDIVYGHGVFVAVGRQGVILTSRNGLIWRIAEQDHVDDWQAVAYRDGRFLVAGDRGTVLYSDDGLRFQPLRNLPDTHCVDVVLLSRQQYILLDDQGHFMVSNDSGSSWQKSGITTGMSSRVIDLAGKDKIISADNSGQLGLAQLVAEIQLDSALKDSQYEAGDIIYLEKATLPAPHDSVAASSPWRLFGRGSMIRTDIEAAPKGGKGCLRLQADQAGGPVILSQQIEPGQLASLRHNEVLQVSLWLRQSGIENRQVKIWLSGPFEPIGTTLTNVGTGWKKYTYALVVPGRPGGYAGQDIRLNLAIDTGELWVDRVFLGHLDESEDLLANQLQRYVDVIQPQVVRLDFLGIGSREMPSENWVWPMHNDSPAIEAGIWQNQRGTSLHAALDLCLASHASPWLVIDSFASEGELLNLIEYLAAPISEPYGRLRQDHGMFSPWTQQFPRIYLEICDRYTIFDQDQARSGYVNMVIRAITQSPYYRQIKSQLVFIDGMTYQDGIMLSKADFHASDLQGELQADRLSSSYLSLQHYLDLIPRNPDKLTSDFLELARSTTLIDHAMQPLRLADLTDFLLFDLGHQTGLVNVEKPAEPESQQEMIWQSAATIVSHAARGQPLEINQLTADLEQGEALIAQDPFAGVRVYGFSDGQHTSLVLVNLSDETTTCQMITDLLLNNARITKYDENGQLLSSQKLRRSTGKITILPGGVVLLSKDEPPEQP